jgi:hypothetical protein
MKTALITLAVSTVAGGALLLLFAPHVHSQAAPAGLALERITEDSFGSGGVTIVDHVKEVVRRDGSRAITQLRAFRNTATPAGWQARESRLLYRAADDSMVSITPELKSYVKMPGGSDRYKPLAPVSTCVPPVVRGFTVKMLPGGTRFTRSVEAYRMESLDPEIDESTDFQVYPEFGCLQGDVTTETHKRSTGELLWKSVQRVVALDVVEDDPELFVFPLTGFVESTASETLNKIVEETPGAKCSTCLSKTGAQADARLAKAWRDRSAGKR